MDDFDVARVVDEFWRERARGVYFPPRWFGRLTLDQGYRSSLACSSGGSPPARA